MFQAIQKISGPSRIVAANATIVITSPPATSAPIPRIRSSRPSGFTRLAYEAVGLYAGDEFPRTGDTGGRSWLRSQGVQARSSMRHPFPTIRRRRRVRARRLPAVLLVLTAAGLMLVTGLAFA